MRFFTAAFFIFIRPLNPARPLRPILPTRKANSKTSVKKEAAALGSAIPWIEEYLQTL